MDIALTAQTSGNQKRFWRDAAFIFARTHFVNVHLPAMHFAVVQSPRFDLELDAETASALQSYETALLSHQCR